MRLSFSLIQYRGYETLAQRSCFGSFARLSISNCWKLKVFPDGNSEEATPDPIPNSEVKLLSADDTALVGK